MKTCSVCLATHGSLKRYALLKPVVNGELVLLAAGMHVMHDQCARDVGAKKRFQVYTEYKLKRKRAQEAK